MKDNPMSIDTPDNCNSLRDINIRSSSINFIAVELEPFSFLEIDVELNSLVVSQPTNSLPQYNETFVIVLIEFKSSIYFNDSHFL